eukprot:3939552-Rhodomonas_salina.3
MRGARLASSEQEHLADIADRVSGARYKPAIALRASYDMPGTDLEYGAMSPVLTCAMALPAKRLRALTDDTWVAETGTALPPPLPTGARSAS